MAKVEDGVSPSHKTQRFRSTLGEVFASREPKNRPPDSLRDRLPLLVHGSLPKYAGPYRVGTMEIEVPAKNPRVFSSIRRNGRPALRLETVLMNIFYPSVVEVGSRSDPSGGTRWSRETWLPKPRLATARGYGAFSGAGILAVPFFGATSMFTKLPAFRNAPLATHWSPEGNLTDSGPKVKSSEGSPPEGVTGMPQFPLLIFSHGLGGNRGMYSSLCGEFASYGFVVIALEHRDGSGPCTFVNHPSNGEASAESLDESWGIEHSELEKKDAYDKIGYLFPKGNPRDTDPQNEKGVDAELRAAQIDLRCAEILEAYDVMCTITRGNGDDISNRNLRCKPHVGSSSKGLIGVDWAAWRDRVRLDDVTMVGHSFGAATTVNVLRQRDGFPWVSAGIIYDVWAGGIPTPQDRLQRVRVPLLAINSEAFSYWKTNFDRVRDVIDEAVAAGRPAWHLTVRGTVHVNQSDFSLLYPHLCSYLMKMTANPLRALDLNITASLEFLCRVLPAGHARVVRALHGEGILELPPVDVEHLDRETDKDGRRPDQRYIATKLKIPHEFAYRFGPRAIARRYREHMAVKHGAITGRAAAEDEIWMHSSPEHQLNREREGAGHHEDDGPTA